MRGARFPKARVRQHDKPTADADPWPHAGPPHPARASPPCRTCPQPSRLGGGDVGGAAYRGAPGAHHHLPEQAAAGGRLAHRDPDGLRVGRQDGGRAGSEAGPEPDGAGSGAAWAEGAAGRPCRTGSAGGGTAFASAAAAARTARTATTTRARAAATQARPAAAPPDAAAANPGPAAATHAAQTGRATTTIRAARARRAPGASA